MAYCVTVTTRARLPSTGISYTARAKTGLTVHQQHKAGAAGGQCGQERWTTLQLGSGSPRPGRRRPSAKSGAPPVRGRAPHSGPGPAPLLIHHRGQLLSGQIPELFQGFVKTGFHSVQVGPGGSPDLLQLQILKEAQADDGLLLGAGGAQWRRQIQPPPGSGQGAGGRPAPRRRREGPGSFGNNSCSHWRRMR